MTETSGPTTPPDADYQAQHSFIGDCDICGDRPDARVHYTPCAPHIFSIGPDEYDWMWSCGCGASGGSGTAHEAEAEALAHTTSARKPSKDTR